MKEDKVQYLVGNSSISDRTRIPFDTKVCDFLSNLSKVLREDKRTKKYSDIQTFAYWIRKGHIGQLKQEYESDKIRLGRGMVFHIAPSNVPINFAYSLVFGMLSGNSNIVRVPSKKFPQVDLVCEAIKQVLEEYEELKDTIAIVRYERSKEVTDYFSEVCDARVIWGGDQTINVIRKSPIPPRAIEITFADRYSFGVIDAASILKLTKEEVRQLAMKFYNDTYLMDQNACSSPHMLLWKVDEGGSSEEARDYFWNAVYEIVKEKYDLASIKASDKFTQLYSVLATNEEVTKVRKYENYLYVLTLSQINEKLEKYRGKFGLFFEHEIHEFKEIAPYIDKKVQTCTYYGVEKQEVIDSILSEGIKGIDRIVSFGEAMDIEMIWDGYNILEMLSRIIH